MFRKFLIAAVAVIVPVASSMAASSNELLIQDQMSSKGTNRVFSLDYVSDGSAVGLQVRIKLNGATAKSLDLKNCLSDLPKSHEGSCKLTEAGDVLVLVYSGVNAPLPAGMVSIGRIAARGGVQGKLEVTELLVSDKNANPISATSAIQ